MNNERITADMSTVDMIMTMCEGVPGSMNVMIEILKQGPAIDTDAGPMGGFGPILQLDSLGIYGIAIWRLYKYVCGESVAKTIALLRAYQMGQLAGVTKEALLRGIDNRGAGLDVDAAVAAVQAALPGFKIDMAA